MSDDQYIVDEGDLRKYRIEIPNMADDELDPYQFRLYAHYKRVGLCWESVRTTAKKTRMSTGQVVDIRDWLVSNGWIDMYSEESDIQSTYLIVVKDRWLENFKRYAERSQHEQGVHNMNNDRSQYEPKKELIDKKEPKKKKESATPRPPAVLTYVQVASINPNKLLYEDIANVVGESPEDLERWAAHIKDWIASGWKKTNIKGLLESYARGGIAPRTTGQPAYAAKRQPAPNPADNPNYYEEAAARENEEYTPKGQRQPASASPALHTFASGKSAPDVWAIACDELSGQLDRDVYHATLGLSQFVEYAEGFVIRVGNQGIKERLEKRLAGRVESALENAAGEAVPVRYVVAGEE